MQNKIFLISNNEPERQNNMDLLYKLFSKNFRDFRFEIFAIQIDNLNLNNYTKFIVVFKSSLIFFKYSFYFRLKRKFNLIQNILNTLKDLIDFFNKILIYKKYYEKIKIEMFLTQKHLSCWRNQSQYKVNRSIIIENDLHLSLNEYSTLESLKNFIKSNSVIFFSHSIELKHLMIENLIQKKNFNSIAFNQIISNGCSGYSLPLQIADYFVELVNKLPQLVFLPVDFMIVALGLELEKIGIRDVTTVFLYPSDFTHLSGSVLESKVQIKII